VITLFHEFGHTLHGLFASQQYATLSGTNTPRDFVEFPSQINEHWASHPQVFAHYARHFQTGEPMPDALREKMLSATQFNKGYDMTELLSAALLDMNWHSITAAEAPGDIDAFETAALENEQLHIPAVPPRYRSSYFANSFHLDVEKKVNPYDKIDFEAAYPPIASGGFICYGEYPNIQHNLKALEDVWDYSYQHVPYYGTNTPIDECYECGFTGEFECTSKGFTCPKCGNHDAARVSVTRRVCGYLGSPDARPFNAGKQEEVKRRVKHLGNGQIG
jgi:predicted RNA-binding Zn-ribbon protein involved in translation (DUF1610 family)